MLLVATMLAACGRTGDFACRELGPGPVRTDAESLDPLKLGESVDEHATDRDFREPSGDGLELDLRGELLFVRGTIDADSCKQVREVLSRELRIGTLVFTMVPGSIDDETNLALGRMLRNARIVTYLPARGMVASGGTDLFLAGVRRVVERGSRVGVHSWRAGGLFGRSAVGLPRDHRDHTMYLDYYRVVGIPEDFYWFTLQAASPDDVHWMTDDEMATYRTYTDLIR